MFSGRDCGRHFVFADELEGAEMESDGGAAADAFARALERNHSRGRIADGGFSPGGRKDRGAALAQCRFGAENISGGWDAGGWNWFAAAGNRGGSGVEMEVERAVFFVSIGCNARDGLSLRFERPGAGRLGEAGGAD